MPVNLWKIGGSILMPIWVIKSEQRGTWGLPATISLNNMKCVDRTTNKIQTVHETDPH